LPYSTRPCCTVSHIMVMSPQVSWLFLKAVCLPLTTQWTAVFFRGGVNALNCRLLAGNQLLLDWLRENTLSRIRIVPANSPLSYLFSVNHLLIWSWRFLNPDIAKIMPRYNVQDLQHLLDGLSLSFDRTDQIIDNLLVFHTFDVPDAPFDVREMTIGIFQTVFGRPQFCFRQHNGSTLHTTGSP
jgi:hypothetical protein